MDRFRTGPRGPSSLQRSLATHIPDVLLATDLHRGNVLRRSANRGRHRSEAIIGDPAYDATQHLLNCTARLRADPLGTIRRVTDLLEVNAERVRLWMFARAASGPRDDWDD